MSRTGAIPAESFQQGGGTVTAADGVISLNGVSSSLKAYRGVQITVDATAAVAEAVYVGVGDNLTTSNGFALIDSAAEGGATIFLPIDDPSQVRLLTESASDIDYQWIAY